MYLCPKIFQRGNYLWIAYYHHGKEQREVARHRKTDEKLTTSDKDRKEAELFLKQRLGELTAEKHGGPAFIGTQEKRLTVNDLLDSLESDYKTRNKDNAQFQSHLKRIRSYFGAWKAIEVSADSIAAYIAEMREDEYTDSTINRGTQLLGQAYELAMKDRKLTSAPRIEHLSEVGNERAGFFETGDFNAVVEKLPEYLKDFVRFGFITGWRKSAIQKLRWESVGDDVIYLAAKNSKTRKPESIPIEGELQEIIERRRAAQVWEDEEGEARFSVYVFHVDGQPVGDFRKAWATACKAAKVGSLLFHDLRRTAARNMIAAGTPQAVAMKITGHRTDAMFRRYAIVNEDQKRDALANTQKYVAANAARKVVAMKSK